ncbi:MAG: DUF1207 domain-containing protein [Thermoguttaceae bacterium]
MSFRRCLPEFLSVALCFAGMLASAAVGQMVGPPAMTSQPPQQMPVYEPATPYPSTPYPTTPYPATPFPSTPYPSTPYSASAAGPTGLPDFASANPIASGASAGGNSGTAPTSPLYTPYGSPEAMSASLAAGSDSQAERLLNCAEPMQWLLGPTGLMYKSYLAGEREPRMGSELTHERTHGWYWQATVGGRVGLIRYGTDNSLWPQGWQLDAEGAAFPRLDLEHEEDLDDCDYRGGLLSTTRQGPIETKFGYYHLSSHLGDEYMIRYPDTLATRINYVRDSLIGGIAVYANPSLRLYGEVGWCFHEDGGARPWELQFGADFISPEPTGIGGTPFFAINGHLRQENNYSGNLSVQTGWAWRGRDGHLLRTGMQYFNGMSDHYEFYNTFEEEIGWGLWYDY